MSKQYLVLVWGFLAALIVSLSIHIVMLQNLGVPYPDHSTVPMLPRYINTGCSLLALLVFYHLASHRLSRLPLLLRCLLVFALYAMVKEALIRANVMEGVVTTAWVFPWIKSAPRLLSYLLVACAVVLLNPIIKRRWQMVLAAVVLAAVVMFGLEPLLGAVFNPIIGSFAYLAHDDVYAVPYGWQVMIPAYITYAEPVLASFVIVALTWQTIARQNNLRIVYSVLLGGFMKGALLPLFLYSPFLDLNFPTAMLSESQFTFEVLALALIVALTWWRHQTKTGGELDRPGALDRRHT